VCQIKKYKNCNTQIDKCIRPLIKWLLKQDFAPVSSCCGHDKYPMTIVVRWLRNGKFVYHELFTNKKIPRTRNFYKRDSEEYYYIPEVCKEKKVN